MSVRKAEKEDLREIAAIAKECLTEPLDEVFFYQEWKENPIATILVYEEEKRILGFLDFYLYFEVASIAQFAVRKREQKRGIGKTLLKAMEEILKKEKDPIWVINAEVRKTNQNAILFYEHMGFQYYDRKPQYYSDKEDALCYYKGVDYEQNSSN